MAGLSGFLAAGRSLATAAVAGIGHGTPGRLAPLDLSAFEAALAAVDPVRAGELHDLVEGAGIAGLHEHMAAGRITSEELVLHLLARVRAHESALNSIVELNPHVLTEAQQADARRAAGEPLGGLHGIPVTIKDNIETAGPMRTTGGAEILADHVAGADAPLVDALRVAGAVILGKANLSELAGAVVRTPGFSAVGGQTANPYGPTFSSGGSSSGSAVSVAAGLAIVSVGTETSGSLLAPAGFNGVVAMKPSRGVVDGRGVIPLVRHQDSAGPVARTVADAAALLRGMATRALEVDLAPDALVGVVVGVLADDIRGFTSPYEDTGDNQDMLARIDAGLRAAGAAPRDVAVVDEAAPGSFDAGFVQVVLGGVSHDTIGYLAGAGAPVASVGDLHSYNLRQPRRRMPSGQFFLDLAVAQAIDFATYEEAALGHRAKAERILDATFAAAGADVLVSISNRHSSLYATAGYPAITVPLGLRANGMPSGAVLIGRPGSDGQLLGFAHAFEQATGLRVAPELPVAAQGSPGSSRPPDPGPPRPLATTRRDGRGRRLPHRRLSCVVRISPGRVRA